MRSLAKWAGRLSVGIIILGCLGLTIVSVQSIRRDDQANAAAQAGNRTAEVRSGAQLVTLDRLGRSLADAARRRDRDRSDATSIDESVELMASLRSDLDVRQQAITAAQGVELEGQRQLAIIETCRRSIDAAAQTFAVGSGGAAALFLEQGRATCSKALEPASGPNGALHPYDFADPHLLAVGITYYAYGTNGPAGSIQVLSSSDRRSWQVRGSALGGLPLWAKPGWTWSPSVVQMGERFVMHYTVRTKGSGKQCISSAVADSPTGPFIDQSPWPVVCQTELGGSIDPSAYQDEVGFWHLSWKSEDETVGGKAKLWTQFLSADGRFLIGVQRQLLTSTEDWEEETIENPSMAKIGGLWLLLYSGNKWNTTDYAMGYAVCATSEGPCRRPDRYLVKTKGDGVDGPGGGQFLQLADGTWRVAYAGWNTGAVGYPNPRLMHLAAATLGPDGLVLT